MRNYELINEIYAELVAGDGTGGFTNPYLNTVIKLTKLIEEERPELKGLAMDNQLVAARRANLEKKEELLSGEDHYMKPFLWDGRPLDE